VVHRLIANKRIDPRRTSSQGFTKHRPLASNESPEKRAENRRVEISVEVPIAK
jgi:chemotaxis protein MotB